MNVDNNVTNELKELCALVISQLNKLKSEGKISEEDYIKHTRLKKEFIKNIKNK